MIFSAQQIMAIKLLTLDVDNTLLRVAGGAGLQYTKTAQKFNINLDADAVNKAFKTVRKEHKAKYPNYGQRQGLSSQQWWAGLVNESFRLAGYAGTAEQLRPMNEELYRYFISAEPWEILPRTHEVLHKLQMVRTSRRYLTVGIVSNFDGRLKEILTNLGLIQNFDFVLASFVEKSEKPEKAIFLKALEIAGVKPKDALHVGDDVINDYNAARAVGMNALLLRDEATQVPPGVNQNHIIKSLGDIFNFLE